MDASMMTDDELQDVIRSGITAARNGRLYDRAALRAALAEFRRRESAEIRAERLRSAAYWLTRGLRALAGIEPMRTTRRN